MAVPVALMAAGTALQVIGQYQANLAQAKAERANAEFYRDQATFAKEAEFRAADIAAKTYERVKGTQISAYARGGVDISGSAAGVVAQTLADKVSELSAIKKKGDIEYRLATARARAADAQANTLEDPFYNLQQASGTVLTNFAKSSDSWAGKGGGSTAAASSSGSGGGGSGYLGANTKFNY